MNDHRGSWTLSDFPHDVIRIVCPKCQRQGRYRRASLIARFGADRPMPDVLGLLAACPDRQNFSDPCQAVFADRVR